MEHIIYYYELDSNDDVTVFISCNGSGLQKAERMMDFEQQLKKFQKELNSGTAALVLLAVLARADEPLYGYQIAKQLEAADARDVAGKQSALYPVLRNMSAAGLLESWVEPSVSGPPRRYYRITADGREMLLQWRGAWRDTADFVATMLNDERSET